jgi:DNA-directed RNA polymerase subunit RPC12/RpoP
MTATTTTSYYQHKFKCLECSLHYLVCSDYEEFPQNASRVYCPECGSTGAKLRWVDEVEGFIFQLVGGNSRPSDIPKEAWAALMNLRSAKPVRPDGVPEAEWQVFVRAFSG